MDLIRLYNDQESQSSSSCDDANVPHKANPPTTVETVSGESSSAPSKVSSFQPLERIPIERLMIAAASIAANKTTNQKEKKLGSGFSLWVSDVDKEIRMCLGSIKPVQKHKLLESMDFFISKLTRDFEKILKPLIADYLSNYIRTYMQIYKFLFRSHNTGKRYFKRVIKILAIYTDLELCASIRGTEYDRSIAERIVLVYQTYLDNSDNSMALDVLLNIRRLWRRHRGILVLLFEYFLVRKTSMEMPDSLYIRNLIMFKQWLRLEEVADEQALIREAFIKFVKPKKTICMNSLFKPYLPVDGEGYVTVTNAAEILDKEISITKLTQCLKKSEERTEVRANEVVIVLTDDENSGDDHTKDEDEDSSSNRASSRAYSHQEEISNDFDWESASSQQGTQSSQSQNVIETVSVDSPPPYKQASSLSSLDSCDLNLDTTNSMTATESNNESAQNNDQPNCSSNSTSSDKRDVGLNGGVDKNNQNLSTLDESIFNRLVNDMNSTQLSIPSAVAMESADIRENGEINQIADSNNDSTNNSSAHRADLAELSSETNGKVPVNSDQTNCAAKTVLITGNGDAEASNQNSDNKMDISSESQTSELGNHVDMKAAEELEPIKNCDKNIIAISNSSPFKFHEETLKNIDEIVADDMKKSESSTAEQNANDVQKKTEQTPNKVSADIALSPLAVDANENDETAGEAVETEGNAQQSEQNVNSTEKPDEPAAESIVSVLTETSLLTKSEQEILFKDKDVPELFTDLWNGERNDDITIRPEENKSPSLSINIDDDDDDGPLTFLHNGIDPNFRLKTYSRNRKLFVETKTISTQTGSASARSSPITLIDTTNTGKHLLTDDDDEMFLRDIFDTSDIPVHSMNSIVKPSIKSYSSSTPIPSTSKAVFKSNQNVQSMGINAETSLTPIAVIPPVKGKRGRPRKYPLQQQTNVQPITVQPIAAQAPADVKEKKRRGRRKKGEPIEPIVVHQPSVTVDRPIIPRRRISRLRTIRKTRPNPRWSPPPPEKTILRRQTYIKPLTSSTNTSQLSTSNLSDNSMLRSSTLRSNGQLNSSNSVFKESPYKNLPFVNLSYKESSFKEPSSTILARKTYIQPNQTVPAFSTYSLTYKAASLIKRRYSVKYVESIQQKRQETIQQKRQEAMQQKQQEKVPQKRAPSIQKYSQIVLDTTPTSKRRGRKPGPKNAGRKSKNLSQPVIIPNTSIVKANESIELNNERIILPSEFDMSKEIQIPITDIYASPNKLHAANESTSFLKKRRDFSSEGTETDMTNEFTTDPDSTVEDADDGNRRKSKRRRKRPKILDL